MKKNNLYNFITCCFLLMLLTQACGERAAGTNETIYDDTAALRHTDELPARVEEDAVATPVDLPPASPHADPVVIIPEQPEQPERPEQPEQAEQTEQSKQPAMSGNNINVFEGTPKIDPAITGTWWKVLSRSQGVNGTIEKREFISISPYGNWSSTITISGLVGGGSAHSDGPPNATVQVATDNNRIYILTNGKYLLGGSYSFSEDGNLVLKDALTGNSAVYFRK